MGCITESISFGAHQMRDGVNLSNQKQTKSVVSPSQIMMLKDLEAYLKFPGDLPVTKIALPYLKLNYGTPVFIQKKPKDEKQEKKQEVKEQAAEAHAAAEQPSISVDPLFADLTPEKNKPLIL